MMHSIKRYYTEYNKKKNGIQKFHMLKYSKGHRQFIHTPQFISSYLLVGLFVKAHGEMEES